jgi:hypothetical protein
MDVRLDNLNTLINQGGRKTDMKSSEISLLSLVIFTVLAGCASTSAVTPYGRDSYIVSAQDSMHVPSPAKLQVRAAQKANEFCASKGMVMHVRNTSNNVDFSGSSSSLICSCISESDPEHVRPDLRTVPDTVIEGRGM